MDVSRRGTTSVDLRLNLQDLPSAQHKAGLAGLVLQIRSMRKRYRLFAEEDIPELLSVDSQGATIGLTQNALQRLFDDLYEATIVEVLAKSKWAGLQPKRTETTVEMDPRTGRSRRSRRYAYDVVQPTAPCLVCHYPAEGTAWLKLWRDMIWNIQRSRPTTRTPYIERAHGRTTTEGQKVWNALNACRTNRRRGKTLSTQITGALFLGGQAMNAEGIPFVGRTDISWLLHFWPLAVLVFVPRGFDRSGTSVFHGYSVAIPKVRNLQTFCDLFPQVLRRLDPRTYGYQPAAAIIDTPEQAGFEFTYRLEQEHHNKPDLAEQGPSVFHVEYLHVAKIGKNSRVLANGNIAPSPRMTRQYAAIYHRSDQVEYRHPLFRKGLFLSMTKGVAWFQGMRDMLLKRELRTFVRRAGMAQAMPHFCFDAAKHFQRIKSDMDGAHTCGMGHDGSDGVRNHVDDLLAWNTYQTIVAYLTCHASGDAAVLENGAQFDGAGYYRSSARALRRQDETRERLVATTFSLMRSRRDRHFASFFIQLIDGQVEKCVEAEYLAVLQALSARCDDVQTLTLLALSACSSV